MARPIDDDPYSHRMEKIRAVQELCRKMIRELAEPIPAADMVAAYATAIAEQGLDLVVRGYAK